MRSDEAVQRFQPAVGPTRAPATRWGSPSRSEVVAGILAIPGSTQDSPECARPGIAEFRPVGTQATQENSRRDWREEATRKCTGRPTWSVTGLHLDRCLTPKGSNYGLGIKSYGRSYAPWSFPFAWMLLLQHLTAAPAFP
jgi:hypothetical protein